MGLEAYRLCIKFSSNPTLEDVESILVSLGGNILSKEPNGDSEINFNFNEGIIEILISTIKDQNKILAQITGQQTHKIKVNPEEIGKTILNLRFAKPNSLEIVDKIIQLLKDLDTNIKIKFVGDIESKHEINLENYDDFKTRVFNAKEEFNKWFPPIPYPVSCKDVFNSIRKIKET